MMLPARPLQGAIGCRTLTALRHFIWQPSLELPMSASDSVTGWIAALRTGDAAAAQPLWERYFTRLVGLARRKLQGQARAAADEEDVALSAFASFCRGAATQRFPCLNDRADLWQVLVLLTARKAYRLLRHEGRLKRGGGGVRHLSELVDEDSGVAEIVGREPTPEFAARVAEECRLRLDELGDAELRAIALWKMEGFTTEEIAVQLGCVPRTVERKLRMIRGLWQQETPP
jgi:DNA-directed RNA polymerase specialized sigma24 family protein